VGEAEQVEASGALEPQPAQPRGSRSFLQEVGIIVLGVLIALVVGEAANAVRQRVEARRSMDAIRADMIDNSSTFEIAALAAPCAQRRLNELSDELAIVRKGGRLRRIGEIGRLPISSFRSGSWDSAVANRDVLFLDRDDVGDLTDYHDVLRTYQTFRDEGDLDWARLSVLSNVPGPMDDNTLAAVSQTIAELRYRTRSIETMARVLVRIHKRLGFPIVYTPYNGEPQTRERSLRRIRETPLCRPLDVGETSR
jgi:hypothetical protein